MRKPSGLGVREIAKKLNLNISTVSRALNGSYQVSKETTELVLRTANEMGYHKQQTKKCIVVLLPASNVTLAWYTMNLINSLKDSLIQRNYYWEFINIDRIDILQERSVTGIISIDFTGHIAKQVSEKYNIPLVCINDASDHSNNVCTVCSDPASAIALSFGCLYDYGHRNIAFISVGGHSHTGLRRKAAFQEIVAARNLQDSCIHFAEDLKTYHGLVRELSRKGITGIITDGESSGLKIFNSLNYCNLKIPKRMSLVTWELPYVSSLIQPPLTTVEQNFPELAERSVQLLESLIRGNAPVGDVFVPYRLHLRDSVSIPRE